MALDASLAYRSGCFHCPFNSQKSHKRGSTDRTVSMPFLTVTSKNPKTHSNARKQNGHQIHDHAYHVVSLNLFLILLASFCFLFIYCCSFMLIYIWFNDIVLVIITHINININFYMFFSDLRYKYILIENYLKAILNLIY